MMGIVFTVPSISGGKSIPFKQQFTVFRDKKIVTGFLITLLVNAGSQTVYTFLTPLLQETIHMGTTMISITMFVLGVFSMIGTRLGGYGADRFGVARTVFLSLMIHAIALLFLPILMASIVTTVLVLAIWMGFNWMASPALQTYFIQQAPDVMANAKKSTN